MEPGTAWGRAADITMNGWSKPAPPGRTWSASPTTSRWWTPVRASRVTRPWMPSSPMRASCTARGGPDDLGRHRRPPVAGGVPGGPVRGPHAAGPRAGALRGGEATPHRGRQDRGRGVEAQGGPERQETSQEGPRRGRGAAEGAPEGPGAPGGAAGGAGAGAGPRGARRGPPEG